MVNCDVHGADLLQRGRNVVHRGHRGRGPGHRRRVAGDHKNKHQHNIYRTSHTCTYTRVHTGDLCRTGAADLPGNCTYVSYLFT